MRTLRRWTMNEWMCDECKYKDVPITTFPCCDCLDGDRFEPEEGSEDLDYKDGEQNEKN